MFKRTKLASSLLMAFGGAVLVSGPPARAQENLERVTVTGSNIARSDKETASPVQVITSDDLQKSGYSTVSEVLRELTANGQGTLNQGFNQAFAAGASGVSLRGLTVGATLVLIDGHRMAPYPLSDDGQRAFVDISSIPFAAVERIEILKDGASAVYGSDAIAGVVNVILKKNFEGTLLTADVGKTQHGGGATKSASITHGFGKSADPMSGFLSFEYRKQNEIKLNQRDGDWTNFDWRPQGGLDLRPGARNTVVSTPRLGTPYLQLPGGAATDPAAFAFYPGCTYVQMRASQCQYQNTWAQIQPESENVNILGKFNAKLVDDWELSVAASLFNSKSQQTRAPANIPFGSFAGNTAIGPGLTPAIIGAIPTFTVPASYPGNTLGAPANIRAIFPLSDRLGRVEDVESKSSRLVAELNGSVVGWDFRSALGYTRVKTEQKYSGYVNNSNLLTALNDPTSPFLLAGGNSAEVLDFVSPSVRHETTDTLTFAEARVSKELFTLPGGPFAFGAGIGLVHKNLNAPDAIEAQNGTVAGISGAYAVGKETNTSLYMEAVAPVIKSLELDAALRYDHYDTYGNSYTPKFGFKFTPLKEFTLRGTASRGFRAPSATENGTAGSLFSFNAIRDPILCPTSNANGTPNQTAATNVPTQCTLNPTYLQGTSKSLQPEKSKSYTLGVIVEPVVGWSTTLDYYLIQVNNQIVPAASLASFDPLAFAVRSAPQVVTFGDGSTGLSAVGPIQYVDTPYVNGQKTETSGLEFETRYRWKLPNASVLNVGFQITHMLKYDLTLNGQTFKLAGTHGPAIISGDTGNPKNRAQFSLGYDIGFFSIAGTVNYVSGFDVTDPSNGVDTCLDGLNAYNSQFANGSDPPTQYCRVPSFTYANITGQYRATSALTVRFGITNLFDKEPPLDLSTYGGTGSNSSSNGTGAPYNPSVHQIGAVGRAFSVGVDYKF